MKSFLVGNLSGPRWAAAGLLTLIALCLLPDGSALAKPRRPSSRNAAATAKAQREATIRAANAQLAAARQVLSAAESSGAGAQAKLSVSLAKLQQAADEMKQAHESVHELERGLAETEQEILEEQGPSSPFAEAKRTLETAKQNLIAVESRVLSQPAIAETLAGLKGVERATRKSKLLQGESEYQIAREHAEAAGKEFDRIRRALFFADNDWKETNTLLAEARQDIAEAERTANTTGIGRITPLKNLRDAKEAAAAARMVIAQSEAVLKRMGASPSSPSSSGGNRGK